MAQQVRSRGLGSEPRIIDAGASVLHSRAPHHRILDGLPSVREVLTIMAAQVLPQAWEARHQSPAGSAPSHPQGSA
jgi:hypothetical protein